jgi:hypothetical protein
MSAVPVRDNGTAVIVQFNSHFSYRRTGSTLGNASWCNETTVQQNQLIGQSSPIKCRTGCTVASEIVGNTLVYCQAYSVEGNWSFGINSFTFTAPKSSSYQISYASGTWGRLAVVGVNATGNITSSYWEIRMAINLLNRTDTKIINRTPVTLIAPTITIPQGIQYPLRIPNFDLDGDNVTCIKTKL